mmetsp:Transcript_5159/g.7492  ORF Transcript_5159/g.7492 Transcript_5159/m.7492 type:complete len:215 (-) Transcript_5159:186-830(-)
MYSLIFDAPVINEKSFTSNSPFLADFAILRKMNRQAARATGNDILDKSTSHDESSESSFSMIPLDTASANTLSARSLLIFPIPLSRVAITSVNVTISGDTFSLLLVLHISTHRSNTCSGSFDMVPALIKALYATRSGCNPSFFMSLNNSNAGSHFSELAQAVIADVYAILFGFVSRFIASMRSSDSCHRPAAPHVLIADENVNESRLTPSFSMQ